MQRKLLNKNFDAILGKVFIMPPIKSQDNNRRHFRLFYLTPFLFSKSFMHQENPDTANIGPKHVA
ncbi:hypothetical protein, partial [Treponema succinifaciens]|uniref:hypothetical protein n=1 Tax=Treponema succinifaciens TaxID=167 RepID=UPI0023F646EF